MEVMVEKESVVGWNLTPPLGSVGWNSTPPPTMGSSSTPSTTSSVISTPNAYRPPRANPVQFPPDEGTKKNTSCFYCKQEGHWVRDCPMKTPKRPPQPPSSAVSDGFPIVHCICGAPCVVRVSKTSRNMGREFYSCPLFPAAKKCDFFKWCKGGTSVVNVDTPTCACQAGHCRIYKETSGPDAGRRFFVCPIKKGQGACKFLQPVDSTNNIAEEQLLDSSDNLLDEQLLHATVDLLDEHLLDGTTSFGDETQISPQSTVKDSDDSSPSSWVLLEEGDSSSQGMEIECLAVDTPEHPRKLGTNSELSMEEREPLVDSQGYEGTSDEPLRKHCKRLRHGDPKINSCIIDPVSDCRDMPQSKSTDLTSEKALRPSILTSGALIRRRQVKFLRQISSAGASFHEASTSSYHMSSALPTSGELLTGIYVDTNAMYKILGFNFKGWCGRLVFPPSRSLTFPVPKPFFCGVFPCFDPVSPPQDAYVPEMRSPSSVESSKLSLCTSFQPSGPLLLKSPAQNCQGKTMKGSVGAIFKQAARSLQDELLTLLESMDFHDHAAMLEESYSVFGALERLGVDYVPFEEQVLDYIGHAASLAQVELSFHNDDRSSQELLDCYNCKKLRLDDISRRHAETSSALQASNERLRYLQEEASRLKDMLLQAEEELAHCEAENMEIDSHLNQITDDKLQWESNLEVLFKEAEEAEKREAERIVAKASYEKARSELRQSCNMSFLM